MPFRAIRAMVSTSAVPAGREVPRVHRLLQEFLGVVLPELADVRICVDDGVLELAADPLHLADVEVLRRIAVRIHLDRTLRSAVMRPARSSTLPPIARTASLMIRAPV